MAECQTSSFELTGTGGQLVSDAEDARLAIERCHVLLSEQGDVSGERLANEALAGYQALSGASLNAFLSQLASQFSPDPDLVGRRAEAYRQHPSFERLVELQRAVESPRQELFRRWNLASGGTATLIWFNGGFLEFRRIDWRTPPAVLDNLIKYEAVHQIRDWRELRRRLQDDRRCFGFFHPALPDEPLVFTELALTPALSAKVQPLLDPESAVVDPASCKCAVFYSISSCHDGLRGVSFGNALIRRAVDSLRREFPRLKTFATLSPVPGFRAWLTGAARDGDQRSAQIVALLDDSSWGRGGVESAELERQLVPMCAS
jgi:malonyl-CoA decarboxylase